MSDYQAVRENWVALLEWHLRHNGTRPEGRPEVRGRRWEDAEFALACNLGNPDEPKNAAKNVFNWLYDGVMPKLEPLERALFGENLLYAEWLGDFRRAYEHASNERRQKRRAKATKSTPEAPAPTASRPIDPTAKAPQDAEAFAVLVGEGLLKRGEKIGILTPYFFHQIWLRCRESSVISAALNVSGDSALTELLTRMVAPELERITTQTNVRPARLLEEARYHVHLMLRTEADRFGLIFGMREEVHFVPVLEILERISINEQDEAMREQYLGLMFQGFKEWVDDCIASAVGEEPRFSEILTLYLFAVAYDRGLIPGN